MSHCFFFFKLAMSPCQPTSSKQLAMHLALPFNMAELTVIMKQETLSFAQMLNCMQERNPTDGDVLKLVNPQLKASF